MDETLEDSQVVEEALGAYALIKASPFKQHDTWDLFDALRMRQTPSFFVVISPDGEIRAKGGGRSAAVPLQAVSSARC